MKFSEIKKLAESMNFGSKEYYNYVARKFIRALEEIPDEKLIFWLESASNSALGWCKKNKDYIEERWKRGEAFITDTDCFNFTKVSEGKFKLEILNGVNNGAEDLEFKDEFEIPNLHYINFAGIGMKDLVCELGIEFNEFVPSYKGYKELNEYFRMVFGEDFEWLETEDERILLGFKMKII